MGFNVNVYVRGKKVNSEELRNLKVDNQQFTEFVKNVAKRIQKERNEILQQNTFDN